jgi:hypothetical protein
MLEEVVDERIVDWFKLRRTPDERRQPAASPKEVAGAQDFILFLKQERAILTEKGSDLKKASWIEEDYRNPDGLRRNLKGDLEGHQASRRQIAKIATEGKVLLCLVGSLIHV